jgi:hypothetical protein
MNPLSKPHVRGVLGGAMLMLAACSSDAGPSASAAASQAATGFAHVTLSEVPPNVVCIRVIVDGGGSRVDVAPGKSASFMLDFVPVGRDAFSAFAYSETCDTMNPSVSKPTWTSDEVYVFVNPGEMAEIALAMHPAPQAVP